MSDLGLKARLLVKQFLHRFGYDLTRIPKTPSGQPHAFYAIPVTCQVPNLGFMLELFLGRRSDGEFVEVGAYDGHLASNTWGLARAGWKGLYVEPVPEYAEMCRKNHSGHPRVTVANVAAGSEDGEIDITVAGTLSTIDGGQAAENASIGVLKRKDLTRRVRVPMRRLDSLLSEHGVHGGFDLLSVDVEGAEEQVFQGFDLAVWRPKMMIVELTDVRPDMEHARAASARVGQSIVSSGYTTLYKDSTNTLFVRNDRFRAVYGEAN